MNRGGQGRPLAFSRQGSASLAPSPRHRHVRSGSVGAITNIRRPQATKNAAQRLARVMAQQTTEDDDDDGDEDDRGGLPLHPVLSRHHRRASECPSPEIGRYLADQSATFDSSAKPVAAITTQAATLVKPVSSVPPVKSLAKPFVNVLQNEPRVYHQNEKRIPVDLRSFNIRQTHLPDSYSNLQDEIDMLQEENQNTMKKLHLTEEICKEAEARVERLQKKLSSLEERMPDKHELKRKEADLLQREAALKAAMKETGIKGMEDSSLCLQIEKGRKGRTTSIIEHLRETEDEVNFIKSMAQRMVMNQEQMEEMVLKRCWLARHWKLCLQYGILPEIAESRHEYWSSLSPLPLEVVLAIGQKAKKEILLEGDSLDDNNKIQHNLQNSSTEGNIENMLLVEKGLRELALLKVEDAILQAIRNSSIKTGQAFDVKESVDNQSSTEAFDLTQEECEDVFFKKAWLIYFWNRAKNHSWEVDIANERLQTLITDNNQSPSSRDANDVEGELLELRRLGVETILWGTRVPRRARVAVSKNFL